MESETLKICLEMIILGAGPHANESSTLVVWFPFHWTSWLCFLAGRLSKALFV